MPETPVVTMTQLGERGRFANQLLQYAFLKTYAKIFHLRVETPEWIGQHLFGHNDPPISRILPTIKEWKQSKLGELFTEPVPRYKNVNFEGYFQLDAACYAPYQAYFRSLFEPLQGIKWKMEKGRARLLKKGNTVVGIHIRRGDYLAYQGRPDKKKVFFLAPTSWYVDWLHRIWEDLDNPVLFLASDDLDEIKDDFREFNPITHSDVMKDFPLANYYPDFYLLSQCDVLAISNSTFSFVASLLNTNATRFVRPDNKLRRLIPYKPWESSPLLHHPRSYY